MLALGTSSHPNGGSSAVAPSMDMDDSLLLETGAAVGAGGQIHVSHGPVAPSDGSG